MTKSIEFFATAGDLCRVLDVVEGSFPLMTYSLVGQFDNPSPETIQGHVGIDGLGIALTGDRNHEVAYLVLDGSSAVHSREIVCRDGVVKYAIDQLANPEGVVLRPGGLFRPDCVIAGQLGTCSEQESSMELFRCFAREFRKTFTKIRAYLVGSQSLRIMEDGGRLTMNIQAPTVYDLTAP